MLNKFHKLLIIFMMVFIGACADSNTGGSQDQDGDTTTPPTPENPKWDGTTFTEIIPKGSTYELSHPNHLAWIAKTSSDTTKNNVPPKDFTGKTIVFMNDIDMDNKPFAGIKIFAGRIEGNDKKIFNVNIGDKNAYNAVGFINTLKSGGYIDNLTIASGVVNGGSRTGAFVGEVAGKSEISGIKNYATVTGYNDTGGLVGQVTDNLTITNSLNDGDVTVDQENVGGLVGTVAKNNDISANKNVSLTINNSSNTGNISGKSDNIGGLVGHANMGHTLSINKSTNEGNVSGTSPDRNKNLGGLVGDIVGINNLTIDNSSNKGNVTGLNRMGYTIGGLVGEVYSKNILLLNNSNSGLISGTGTLGGLIGMARTSEKIQIIKNSNTGKIDGISLSDGNGGGTPSKSIGGLLGEIYSSADFIIENSYNGGDITGETNVGGIIGNAYGSKITIKNVYSYALNITHTGPIKDTIGGIIGENKVFTSFAMTNAYWLENDKIIKAIGNQNGTDAALELTAGQFKDTNHASFLDWDFVNTWEILPEGLYPTLKKKQ